MFFLCCLDGSKNIPLWFVAVAVTLTAFAASRAGCVCNKSAQATDATLPFFLNLELKTEGAELDNCGYKALISKWLFPSGAHVQNLQRWCKLG